ncbi:hypothetical protein MC7420_2953 [Coleofasciculus chthonoplastes PCC 7420]|uniref:Uncharacterized protein n=1 Tax=Coleofasciculus chthonoplastes PCC 7420 TaxID=118168 RepID=B4VK68_9CYAN|nr:hypothetical protein MC7420_2953 [Coleofasciculus chthonoplastes PCC 7420]
MIVKLCIPCCLLPVAFEKSRYPHLNAATAYTASPHKPGFSP